MPVLSEDELNAQLSQMHGWTVEYGQISKTYEFKSYTEGLVFAVACGRLAEKRDHHPDMLLTWRKVKCSLSTHSEGGITEKDIALASEFDGLV